MDQFIEFSGRGWPHENLRGMYHHMACKQCGNPFTGPKRATFCFICENDKKDVDNETVNE